MIEGRDATLSLLSKKLSYCFVFICFATLARLGFFAAFLAGFTSAWSAAAFAEEGFVVLVRVVAIRLFSSAFSSATLMVVAVFLRRSRP